MASTNNQASWIGEGWDYQPGYVERSYIPCEDHPRAGTPKTTDLCWAGQIVKLNLAGHSGDLVYDADKRIWRLSNDEGERIELLTDTVNGTHNNEYWRITSRDGTQYYFGRHRLPGWTAGKPVTNSAWTVPVYGAQSGDPCHNPAGFGSSSCQQAWRWNLDYVVDVHNNAVAYYYDTETNHYGANKGTTGVPYERGGYLRRIDYGMTASTVFQNPPAQVVFKPEQRCIRSVPADCAPGNITTKPAYWPDVPFDQNCNKGAACQIHSPTFWSRIRLGSITTQVLSGGSYKPVDSYALAHDFPDPGDTTKAALWLRSITRTGHVGVATKLPPVTFGGQKLINRVDRTNDNFPLLVRYRIGSIQTETGGVISVNYAAADCTAPVRIRPEQNGRRCFPVYWTPQGRVGPILDWFHKYVVHQITEQDPTGGAPGKTTSYRYEGGAAWHYDDNEIVKPKYRTYGQYRGYGIVEVRTGAGPEPITLTKTRYFRGMDGDTVPDSQGGSVPDAAPLAGLARETTVHDFDGGPVLHTTITDHTVIGPHAVRDRAGLPDLRAVTVRTAATRTRTALAAGGWRTTEVRNRYNADGLLTQVFDRGDVTDPAQATCTTTSYAPANTARHIVGLPAEVETDAGPCDGQVNRPRDVLSNVRTFYDDPDTWNAVPTRGDVVKVQQAADYRDGKYVYLTKSTVNHDPYGRVRRVVDALGHATTTDYEPATGIPTTLTVTNPAGHEEKTTLDGARGVPVAKVGMNGERTELTHDSLGRLISVWLPGRDTKDSPSLRFSYALSPSAATAVTAEKLLESGDYHTTVTLYDGLLRPRQTQTATPRGGRLVVDTFYDTRGWVSKANGAYWDDSSAPIRTLLRVTDNLVPNQARITRDGLGRPTVEVSLEKQTEKWRTRTVYGGDRTTVVPPAGGTPTTNVLDGRGRITELHQYTSAPTIADRRVSGGSYQRTLYGYDHRGRPHKVTDPAGNVWTSEYDLLGHKTVQDDPDSGRRLMGYDAAGRLTSSTDARGKTLTYTYDVLDRKSGVYAGGGEDGQRLATWSYDDPSVANSRGRLTSSTRYVDGSAYTMAVTGFSRQGLPLAEKITIPEVEKKLAGTYTFTHGYAGVHGRLLARTTHPGVGGLPQETVNRTYTASDNPHQIFGVDAYFRDTIYSPHNEPVDLEIGDEPSSAWIRYGYDAHTRARTKTLVTRRNTGNPSRLAETNYTYDPVGNITRIVDVRNGTSDTQCFGYDMLRRLVTAWTGTDNCAAAPSTSGPSANVGGPNPYWTSWAFGPDGQRTKQIKHSIAGDTAAATTTYRYPDAGERQPHTLTSTATTGSEGESTSRFTYDAVGNTITRDLPDGRQTLSWDDENHLSAVAQSAGTTSYLYDADGHQLIRRDPGSTTLYLPDTELRLDTTTERITGTRYYRHPAGPTAVRTGDTFSYLIGDHHGTAQTSVDRSGQTAAFRAFMPYGAPRGPQPGSWPDRRGFLGKPDSAVTGLTDVGARKYDAALGRFLSVDPVFNSGDPQSFDGYSYADHNPTTFSDPTGRMVDCVGGQRCGLPSYNNGGATGGPTAPKEVGGCNVNCSKDPDHQRWVLPGAIDRDLSPVRKKPRRWYHQIRDAVGTWGDRASETWRAVEDAGCFISQEGHPRGCGNAPMTEFGRPSNTLRKITGADDPNIDPNSAGSKAGAAFFAFTGAIPLPSPAGVEQAAAAFVGRQTPKIARRLSRNAANGGERLLWTSWQNYPKVAQGGREYAHIGDRLYTWHAVDRMQPRGLGAPAGADGPGRSISPTFIDDILESTRGVPVKGPNGEERFSHVSGSVQVITEDDIVVTVVTR